ncbi:MAG: ABC transporter substrate-binding protein [Lachnospiraceae bacterium]
MRKTFKSAIALGMAATMVLSLGACSSSNNDGKSTSGAAEQTQGTTQGGEDASTAEPEESYDFGGVTVKCFGGFWGNLESEDVAWKEAKEYVEEKYNIVLEKAAMEGYDGFNDDELLLESVIAGDPCVDMLVVNPESAISDLSNDLLVDISEYVDDLKVGSTYIDAATYMGSTWGVAYENIGDAWVLVYNRDYLEELGMEKTPTDMFMEGKWSYDDCLTYLTELQSKLSDGTYAIGSYPYWWAVMSASANGVQYVDANGQLNMTNEAFMEAQEFYQKLKSSGVAYPMTRVTNEDGTNTDDYAYTLNDVVAGKIVIARAEVWQLGGLYDQLGGNWGIVYWPWGSNVTCEGDYTTLSDNYGVALSYWGFNAIVKASVDKLGIPVEVMLQIADDFANYNGDFDYIHDAYGSDVNIGAEAGQERSFCTTQDIELFDWAHTRAVFDWSWFVADIAGTWAPATDMLARNYDVRSTCESYQNELSALLKDAGVGK